MCWFDAALQHLESPVRLAQVTIRPSLVDGVVNAGNAGTSAGGDSGGPGPGPGPGPGSAVTFGCDSSRLVVLVSR